MNKQILNLTLVSLVSDHDNGGKLTVSGHGEFGYFDRSETTAGIIRFEATGKPALALVEAGEGNRVLAIGRLNIEPPNEGNPNHELTLIVFEVDLPGLKPAPARPLSKPTTSAEREKTTVSLKELAGLGI